jgi:AAA domain-containing protein/winged helix-turn-helix DNA-binding protein
MNARLHAVKGTAVPALPADRPATRWTDAALQAVRFPAPRWAVPGLLSEGLNLLAGAPKVRKSWLALSIAADIANGDDALDAIPVEQGPVLYLALEDTGRRLQRRRRQQIAAHGKPAPLLTLETECPVMTSGGDAVLVDWLDNHRDARLVIVDTYERMRGATDPGASAYAADYQAAGRFKTIADHYSVPILLIHHTRKQAADDWQSLVSGTHGLTGAADATMVLERARGEHEGVLHVTGRDVEEADYALQFDPHAGRWSKLDGPADDLLLNDTQRLISRLIRDYPGKTPAAIAEALEMPAATIRQACKRMADKGALTKSAGGQYYPPGHTDAGVTTPDNPAQSHLSLRHSTTPDQGEHQ